jgi:hypothetical protein
MREGYADSPLNSREYPRALLKNELEIPQRCGR